MSRFRRLIQAKPEGGRNHNYLQLINQQNHHHHRVRRLLLCGGMESRLRPDPGPGRPIETEQQQQHVCCAAWTRQNGPQQRSQETIYRVLHSSRNYFGRHNTNNLFFCCSSGETSRRSANGLEPSCPPGLQVGPWRFGELVRLWNSSGNFLRSLPA